MSAALEKTFQLLAKTENEAAVDVLIAALDCPSRPSRDGALRALMDRRSPRGHEEVFRRLATLDRDALAIVEERPDRLAQVAADVLAYPEDASPRRHKRPARKGRKTQAATRKGRSAQGHEAACRAILSCRLYDAMPALLDAVGSHDTPEAILAARTALNLIDLFYEELSGRGEQPKRKDMEAVRRRVTDSLQGAVVDFRRHRCRQLVEAFLLIAKHQNALLRQVLRHTGDSSHQAVMELLRGSSRGGVIRLLLSFLEDSRLPQNVLDVISQRTDLKFVENLLHLVGGHPSRTIAVTLGRVKSLAWARPGHELFGQLDDAAQRGAVGLLCASSIDRARVLEVIGYLRLEGSPAGRRAATDALADFEGPEADALAIQALRDEDPEVCARAMGQLRARRIPDAMSLLIGLVDSPHEVVRDALCRALPEFTFTKFLANFDSLSDALQPTAGHLVRKIDGEAMPLLRAELEGPSPVRRRRAVEVASAMGVVREMEETVIELLSDDDHMVRIAAAQALADCKTMPTWEALRDALLDRSVIVREAAECSLQQICRSLARPTAEELEEVAP